MSQESLSSRLLNRVNVFREKVKDGDDRGVHPSEGQLRLIALVEEAGIALAETDRKHIAAENEIAELIKKLDKHVEADFNPDWPEKAAGLMEQASNLLKRMKENYE